MGHDILRPIGMMHLLGCMACFILTACEGCGASTSPAKATPDSAATAVTPKLEEAKWKDWATESRLLRIPAGAEVPALPVETDVVELHIKAKSFNADGPTCTLTVVSRTTIAALLAHLGDIDWFQQGVRLERVSIVAPDITLTVYETSGIHREYAFYWEGNSFVDSVTNRLIESDVTQLRLLVIDVLIRELAAEQAPENGAAGIVDAISP